jgi:hypothetical protein
VVEFLAKTAGSSTWHESQVTGISYPMDTPAIAAS